MLADSLALDDGLRAVGQSWQPPSVLPSEELLRSGVAALEAQLERCDVDEAKKILSALAATMPSYGPVSELQSRLRAATHLKVNLELPRDLWIEAYERIALSGLKRFPTPGEFREGVAPKLAHRRMMLERAKAMLARYQVNAAKLLPVHAEPQRDTDEARLRVLLKWAKQRGQWENAQRYENDLAAIENRPAEVFAVRSAPPAPRLVEHAPAVVIVPGPASQAALKRALARSWRAQGVPALAERFEQEANALCPLSAGPLPRPDSFEPDEIPEAGP